MDPHVSQNQDTKHYYKQQYYTIATEQSAVEVENHEPFGAKWSMFCRLKVRSYVLAANVAGNQGLFYLNWLLDHKDSFKVLVIEKLGLKAANNIDWSMPRVVCVAGDFTKYDESAIKQMNRNISLIRYKKFGEDLLMFEQVNENVVSAIPDNEPVSKTKATDKTFDEQIRNADENIRVLYENLSNYILSLGDDISESHLKLYAAFKKIRNVVTVVAQKKKLILNLPLDVSTVSFEEGFSRDVTNIGHWGCGAVELYLQSGADFEKAKPLIDRAFDEN